MAFIDIRFHSAPTQMDEMMRNGRKYSAHSERQLTHLIDNNNNTYEYSLLLPGKRKKMDAFGWQRRCRRQKPSAWHRKPMISVDDVPTFNHFIVFSLILAACQMDHSYFRRPQTHFSSSRTTIWFLTHFDSCRLAPAGSNFAEHHPMGI